MTNKHAIFSQNLALIKQEGFAQALTLIKHGVERETLRVEKNGTIAMDSHPKALGSPLSHEWITTDFSEALLEFITPPESDYKKSLQQLTDIHKFTYESIGEQMLWPLSMPCFINSETTIPIAKYGRSNIAKMKEVYRQGLHNRYGSMMQVISGVHFNFSLPDEFWQLWCNAHQQTLNKTTRSAHYFALVRNFRRLAWVIPYLYGASPALCGSFISHKKPTHDFKKVGKGTLYLPYATSLRMSDLGYTSTAQSSLQICYNDLRTYVSSVRSAINQQAEQYSHFSANDQEGWQQLNDKVLQIENELYSPIRPKQVAKSLEMPTNALEDRGVSYLEVRSLDVNPYSPIGIDAQQFHFLDVFLLYCLLLPEDDLTRECHAVCQSNVNKTVLEGRKPNCELNNFGEAITLQNWGLAIIDDLIEVAKILDQANSTHRYEQAVLNEQTKFKDPSKTPSGQWLNTLLDNNIDNSVLALELAKEYKLNAEKLQYSLIQQSDFESEANISFEKQYAIEKNDTKDFSSFVNDYFSARVN